MLIAGAGRHAKDIVAILENEERLFFFDDVTKPPKKFFLENFKVYNSIEEVKKYFESYDDKFILGIGGTINRKKIYDKLRGIGGKAINLISDVKIMGSYDVSLGIGINIMPYTFISNSVKVGDGTLLNTKVSLHHDVQVGKFCDIAPHAALLGGVKVGDYTFVGANATILPDVEVGNNCIVAAGAVVTEDISDNIVVAGVPAKKVNEVEPQS